MNAPFVPKLNLRILLRLSIQVIFYTIFIKEGILSSLDKLEFSMISRGDRFQLPQQKALGSMQVLLD